jgi:hypothetical protein
MVITYDLNCNMEEYVEVLHRHVSELKYEIKPLLRSRFEDLTVFWGIAPCSPLKVNGLFG